MKELSSMKQFANFFKLELNLVIIFLIFLYRGTELKELSSSSSTEFLELELNLVPFEKEFSQPRLKARSLRNLQ